MSAITHAIFISILAGVCTGFFGNDIPQTKGSDSQQCAGMVSTCRIGCGKRTEDQGTEYVQFTVDITTGSMGCEKDVTEKGEMVSANPPSPNHQNVVFNVPCCQQRPFGVITTPKNDNPTTISPATVAPRSLLPPTRKIETKTFYYPSTPSTPKSTTETDGKPDNLSWNNMVLLITTILCFLLLLIILTLMACKIKKKKRGNSLKTDSEASPVTNATTNGAVLTGVVTSEKNKQNKSASEAVSHVVENIPPPPIHNTDDETSHVAQSKDRKGSQDYVVLKTVATTPPKSARSNRPRGLSNKSEEVMIVGRGNRPHGYQNSGIPNGHVGNFYQSGNLTDTTPASPTIQPQLPGRNLQHKKKLREEALKQRSDSLPNGSRDDSMENGRMNNENPNHSEPSTLEGKQSLGVLNPQQHKHIYNILREENIQDSDYQRLNREGKIQITKVKTSKEEDSKNGDDVFTETSEDESIKKITTKDIEELKQTLKEQHVIDDDVEGTDEYGTYFQNSKTPSLSEGDKTASIHKRNDIEMSDYIDTPLLPNTKSTIEDNDGSTVVEYTLENHTNTTFMSGNAKEESSTAAKENEELLQESEDL